MGTLGGPRGIRSSTKEGRLVYNFMNRLNLCAANLLEVSSGPVNTYHGPFGESCIDYLLVPKDLQGYI